MNYYHKNCREEKCENNCKPVDIMSYLHDNMPDELPETMMSYSVLKMFQQNITINKVKKFFITEQPELIKEAFG